MRSLFYNIKQGFIQIFRNRGMSVASLFSITAMLLILGLFFLLAVNINLFTEVVKQDYDQIEVFLDDNVTFGQANDIMKAFNAQDGVSKTEYRSKENALNILKERWGDSGYLLDSLGENPLPASILVSVKTLEDAAPVARFAQTLEGVDDVQFYQETVDKLSKITNMIQVAALIIIAFLIVVSVVIVTNTIKLTVQARSKEITIMKYVGATNWFIRGPFLTEGILIGLISAGVSTGLIALIYQKILEAVGDQIIAIISCPLIPVAYMTTNLLYVFLALGVGIGCVGSIISMRKFLDT